MKTTHILICSAVLSFAVLSVEARVYRWVDAQGNIHYSDKQPASVAKDLSELDQRGIVRKEAEKAISASEVAAREQAKQLELENKRKDQALLMSFSRADEIDFLRDRQIDAVQARLQTNKLRTQATQERLRRISEKQASLLKAKRTVPDGIKADIESAQKELAVFASDEKRLLAEIEDIKARAATDKKRFIELRGQDQ